MARNEKAGTPLALVPIPAKGQTHGQDAHGRAQGSRGRLRVGGQSCVKGP